MLIRVFTLLYNTKCTLQRTLKMYSISWFTKIYFSNTIKSSLHTIYRLPKLNLNPYWGSTCLLKLFSGTTAMGSVSLV